MASTTVDIWSDIHCPWALVTVHRLREARDKHGMDVVFAPRAWPLEWVNHRGTPRGILTVETAALASHEPGLFNAYRADSWPSTFLPAFELVAAARRTHGPRAAEDVDYALRLAFFRDSVDLSIRAGLRDALAIA
jgi:predicted DsbA family dithiol-disulfide isomerase